MIQLLEAVFNGDVLRPDEPLQLAPNTRVRLLLKTVAPVKKAKFFLATVQTLNLDGPTYWSEKLLESLNATLYGDGNSVGEL